jgi:hypothetical protein
MAAPATIDGDAAATGARKAAVKQNHFDEQSKKKKIYQMHGTFSYYYREFKTNTGTTTANSKTITSRFTKIDDRNCMTYSD